MENFKEEKLSWKLRGKARVREGGRKSGREKMTFIETDNETNRGEEDIKQVVSKKDKSELGGDKEKERENECEREKRKENKKNRNTLARKSV